MQDVAVICRSLVQYRFSHFDFWPSFTIFLQAYVRLVFLSYLELIVNSRSELALARVFNVPERELTHSAFTALKHESRQKKMTMYQVGWTFLPLYLGFNSEGKPCLKKVTTGLGMFCKHEKKKQVTPFTFLIIYVPPSPPPPKKKKKRGGHKQHTNFCLCMSSW